MIRRVYIPAPEPVWSAKLTGKFLIALAVYTAFLVGLYGVGIGTFIDWSV